MKKIKLWDSELFSLDDNNGHLNLFALALPLMFQQIFTLLLGTVNTIVLTTVSDEAVAAVNVSVTVLNIPILFLIMPANGAMIIISILLGGKGTEKVKNIYASGVWICIVLSITLGTICYLLAPNLIGFMHVKGNVFEYGVTYFKIRAVFLIFQALATFFTSVLRAHGSSKQTMIYGIITNAVNALLSMLVVNNVFFSDNKIAGVSFAAVIGQIVGLIYAFVSLRVSNYIATGGRFDIRSACRIMKVGVPGGFSLLAYNISSTLVTSMIASLGTQIMNTKVYVSNISNYTYLFGYAVAQAGGIMTGRLCGGRKFEKAKKLFAQNIRTIPLINMTLAIVVLAFSSRLIRIFTNDPFIVTLAPHLFLADIFIEVFRGMTHVGENSLCSIEDTLYTSTVSIVSCFLVNVLLCYVCCIVLKMGLYGYYVACAVDEGIRGLFYRIRWNSGVGLKKFGYTGKVSGVGMSAN